MHNNTMTKKINAANAVVGSIEEAAAIYGVRCYRMQSRVFNVVGIGGRPRPMFVGGWKDRFGTSHKGGMADILNQIARDLRNQQTIQKEISGQLFMYTIFITFAAVVAAPVLFGLTNRMISITDTIWGHILQSGSGGLGALTQSSSLSFLSPHAPTVQPSEYNTFSLLAIIIIAGMSALIVSAISSGSVIKGIKYIPLFIIIGLVIFFVVSALFGAVLGSVATGV